MIRNQVTGDSYYGSSVNLGKRQMEHVYGLRRGDHGNRRMQRSWNKYGEAAFTFAVLAVLEPSEILETENRLLAAHAGRRDCFNFAVRADAPPMLGKRHGAETRAKISAAVRGSITPARREVLSARARGRVPSTETRAKLSAAFKGRVFSPETRARISAGLTGVTKSPEAVAKQIASLRLTHTPEFRKAQADRSRGVIPSPESLAKRSASMKATLAKKRIDRALRLFAANYVPQAVAA